MNPNMRPHGGYVYKERDGVFIRAGSWPAVIKSVTNYRARNGMPAGNPEEEVYAQACQNTPAYCQEDAVTRAPVATTTARPGSLKHNVLSWLSGMVKRKQGGGVNYVDTAEAKRRSAICAGCPKNNGVINSCATCKLAIAAMSAEVLGNKSAVDERCGACGVLGIDLKTAVWLDDPAIEVSQLPGHCWRKRTL